jgi:intracellular multiplication protein IcmV
MKKRSRNFEVLKQFFNLRVWFDYDRTRTFLIYVVNGLVRLLRLQPKPASQSFDVVLKELKLAPEDLKNKQRALLRLCVFMLALASAAFAYALYLLLFGAFKAAFVCVAIILLALVLSFRYHFWYFQIKERKLGCTIREWFEIGLLGKKS